MKKIDFEIQNGELKKYNGPGGDVIVPEIVCKIDSLAFYGKRKKPITSITFRSEQLQLNGSVFRGPDGLKDVIILSKFVELGADIFTSDYWSGKMFDFSVYIEALPLSELPAKWKPMAVAGFAKREIEGKEPNHKEEYLKYIRTQRRKLFSQAVNHTELLQLMANEKMLSKDDFAELLKLAEKRESEAAKSLILQEYERSYGKFDFEENRQKLEKHIAKTGTLPVSELKKLWRWKKAENGDIILTLYKGDETEIEVPAMIGKSAVVEIRGAFDAEDVSLTKDQKDPLTKIVSVVIPDTIKRIGADSFRGCKSLKRVVLPNDLKQIEEFTFWGCSALEEATIPESVKKIEFGAYRDCSSLVEVNIPNKVEEIESNAFRACSALKKITIPQSVNIIGKGALDWCTSLQEIVVSPDNEKYYLDEGMLLDRQGNILHCGPSNRSGGLVMSDNIHEVPFYAFANYVNLERVRLPENIKEIKLATFMNCKSLTEVLIPENVSQIAMSAFENCEKLQKINLPPNLSRIEGMTFKGCTSLLEIVIPEKVTVIWGCAFEDCTNLERMRIPASVTKIQNDALKNCPKLTMYVSAGSYAEKFAIRKKISYIVE